MGKYVTKHDLDQYFYNKVKSLLSWLSVLVIVIIVLVSTYETIRKTAYKSGQYDGCVKAKDKYLTGEPNSKEYRLLYDGFCSSL